MENNEKKYKKPYNLEPNVEAALSYLIPPLTGIPVFIMEKENKFVCFHAFQSILFGILIFITAALVDTFWYLLRWMRPLIGLAFFAGWLYMMTPSRILAPIRTKGIINCGIISTMIM